MTIFNALRQTLAAATLLATICAAPAHAYPRTEMGTWVTSLHARDLGGNPVALDSAEAVFLYDDILDVTWLRNATAGGRHGSWEFAKQWAADLQVGTFDDWRLPRVTYPTGLPGDTICIDCLIVPNGDTFGRNSPTKTGDPTQYQAGQVVYSEMAHLYYVTLGNIAATNLAGNPQPGWGLVNEGSFENLLTHEFVYVPYYDGDFLNKFRYWSETPLAAWGNRFAWQFQFFDGVQGLGGRSDSGAYAMAVRDGDVFAVAAVPEPEVYALMLAGLGLVGFVARRKRQASV